MFGVKSIYFWPKIIFQHSSIVYSIDGNMTIVFIDEKIRHENHTHTFNFCGCSSVSWSTYGLSVINNEYFVYWQNFFLPKMSFIAKDTSFSSSFGRAQMEKCRRLKWSSRFSSWVNLILLLCRKGSVRKVTIVRFKRCLITCKILELLIFWAQIVRGKYVGGHKCCFFKWDLLIHLLCNFL